MAEVDLSEKFPEMTPLQKQPALFSINGCGLSLYGQRSFDAETQTYVKTHCLTLIFVPLLALGAYRVVKAEGGWYLIGKEPLSDLARGWNIFIIAALLIGLPTAGWFAYTATDEYKARQQLAQAQEQIDQGQVVEGLEGLLALSGTPAAEQAEAVLTETVKQVDQMPVAVAPAVFQAGASFERRHRRPVHEDLVGLGLGYAQSHAAEDARAAAAVLEAIEPLANEAQRERIVAAAEPILTQLVDQEPGNPDPAVRLAAIHERRGEIAEAKALLLPHAAALGDGEGARILGQIFADEGAYEHAFALLKPYGQGRLAELHAAEQAYGKAVDRAYNQELARLNEGKAPDSFYNRYDAATEAERIQIVDEYIWPRISESNDILTARERLLDAADVVPAALDLGIVMLHRAQSIEDPDERQKHFQQAEDVFLSIRSLAGESDEYRMYLGQVKYWLGKHDEGKALFDELLAEYEGDPSIMIAVASSLREVGAHTEARALLEEAYAKAEDDQVRYAAAVSRSILRTDREDEQYWLKRSDPQDPVVQSSLASAHASEALEQGDYEQAVEHLSDAAAAYEKQPDVMPFANNLALVYMQMFNVTGQIEHYDKGMAMMKQAVEFEPDQATVRSNYAQSLLERASINLFKGKTRLGMRGVDPSPYLLPHLYDDQAGYEQVRTAFVADPYAQQAVPNLEKVLLTQPKSLAPYVALGIYYNQAQAIDKLKELLARARVTPPDSEAQKARFIERLRGERDETTRAEQAQARKNLEGLIAQARERGDTLAFAIHVDALIDNELISLTLGDAVDIDALLALAEEAQAMSPSAGSRAVVRDLLYEKAALETMEANAEFGAFYRQHRRLLPADELLLIAADKSPSMRKAILDNSAFQQAVDVAFDLHDRFDKRGFGFTWKLAEIARPDRLAAMAEDVRANESAHVTAYLNLAIYPFSPSEVVSLYWFRAMSGVSHEDALEPLRQIEAQGVDMPDLLMR